MRYMCIDRTVSDGFAYVSLESRVVQDVGCCISDAQFSCDSLAKPLKMAFLLAKLNVHLIDFDNKASYESSESAL